MPLAEPVLVEWHQDFNDDQLVQSYGKSPGVYIVRSTLAEFRSVYRFGKKEDCVLGRIRHHAGPTGSYENIGGDLMPYEPVSAWILRNWPAYRVKMAELSLFGALKEQGVQRFFSTGRGKTDNSNFVITTNFRFDLFMSRVCRELGALAALGE